MKAKILLFTLLSILFGCNSSEMNTDVDFETEAASQVLMLKVDYTTNTFKGATVLNFTKKTENFTIEKEYVEPSDFGSIKLVYKELDKLLFFGTIHWMGLGKMTFPEKWEPASDFKTTDLKDIAQPHNVFTNLFDPQNQKPDYSKAWHSVQKLVKVREYLTANPNQAVNLFLYTPSVGAGNPDDWYWVIFLKK